MKKKFYFSIIPLNKCIFSRRNGYVGKIIFGYSIHVIIFGYELI